MMVGAMYFYVEKFGAPGEDKIEEKTSSEISGKKKKKEGEGIMEGFYLIYQYDYVKGIFFISSLFMMQVRILFFILCYQFLIVDYLIMFNMRGYVY